MTKEIKDAERLVEAPKPISDAAAVLRLRGKVLYGITRNLGNYNSARLDYEMEFYLHERTFEEVLAELRKKVEQVPLP